MCATSPTFGKTFLEMMWISTKILACTCMQNFMWCAIMFTTLAVQPLLQNWIRPTHPRLRIERSKSASTRLRDRTSVHKRCAPYISICSNYASRLHAPWIVLCYVRFCLARVCYCVNLFVTLWKRRRSLVIEDECVNNLQGWTQYHVTN